MLYFRKPIRELPTFKTNPFERNGGDKEYRISSESVSKIAELRRPASYLFWCILKELKSVDGLVKINYKMYVEFSKTKSRSSYYEAITDLEACGIIAISKLPLIYVNPNFIELYKNI